MKKKLTMVAALVLVFALGVTGTLAYLTATSDTITNTFTVGNVAITLTETGATGSGGSLAKSYKMVPGSELDKNPTVTVTANSEKCYLFVKVEKSTGFDSYINYAMADGWTELTPGSGVYYRTVGSSASDQAFGVIGYNNGTAFVANKVQVKSNVTQAMMNSVSTSGLTLKFTAYAVQFDNVTDAAAAWAIANPTT